MFRKIMIISFILYRIINYSNLISMAHSEGQLEFPENFYTYKCLYNSANDFALMIANLRAELAKAKQEEIWGFKEPPQTRNAPPIRDSHILYKMDNADRPETPLTQENSWEFRVGKRYLCDMNNANKAAEKYFSAAST